MRRSLGSPSHSGGEARRGWDRSQFLPIAFVIVLVVIGSAGLAGLVVPAASSPIAATSPASAAHDAAASAALPPTHGDLVVGPGQSYTIQPTSPGHTYFQGGNITVEAGGTLNVTNVTLSFVEFIGDTGTPLNRTSHVYHFTDAGTVNLYNATITTDLNVINAYAKLNLSVSGTLNASESSLEFPGWLFVNGSAAQVTLNDSTVAGNPAALGLGGSEPTNIFADTVWAPSIYVLGGAHFNVFGGSITDVYANDLLTNGYTRPTPLNGPIYTPLFPAPAGYPLAGPSDAAALSQDWLYPKASVLGGYVVILYADTNSGGNATESNNTVVQLNVTYGGTNYTLGDLLFKNSTALGGATLDFPTALTDAINAGGLLQYLNYTGTWDTPAQISLNLTPISVPSGGTGTTLINMTFQLNTTGPDYNIGVSGGSTFTAVNSLIALNWVPGGGTIYSVQGPYPWDSNKLTFQDGSSGYLANVTTGQPLDGVFGASAVSTDLTSEVYFYRWAAFNITAGPANQPLDDAQVSVFYAYDTSQANNATATRLNDIATANPAMWGYLEYWDLVIGAPAWGASNAQGVATLLVAASNLTYGTLPDGNFLGGYHVAVSVPGYSVPTHWFNWAVRPYPDGVALGTPGYGMPDYGPAQAFPNYAFTIRIVSANGPGTTTLNLNTQYTTTGIVDYNGTASATIDVYATQTGTTLPILVGTGTGSANQPFTVSWTVPLTNILSPGKSYTLSVTATAYGVTSKPFDIAGTYTVPGPPVNFWDQKILGLPLWLWLVIAAVAAIAIVLFLLFARRQAAGRLVECGECGNLIPEDATVCPKCGAEFEKDLIRCSRCASTIPADSKVCPECAAVLLGKPGEAGTDPEAQGYADFTERYRAEAKRELGDNYSEGAFWDWWKRQPTYTSFSQWKLQQGSGTSRVGMTAPPGGVFGPPAGASPSAAGGAVMPARDVPVPCWSFHWLNETYVGWRFHQSQNAPSL